MESWEVEDYINFFLVIWFLWLYWWHTVFYSMMFDSYKYFEFNVVVYLLVFEWVVLKAL